MFTHIPARPVPASEDQVGRLAAALRALGSPLADQLGRPSTAVADGYLPDFPRWEVLTIAERGEDHPMVTTVALERDGDPPRGLVLDGRQETWDRLVVGVDATTRGAARELAERYLSFVGGARRVVVVASESDIPWATPWSEASAGVLAQAQEAVAGRVDAPQVEAADDGWRVGLTAVDQDRLVRHTLVLRHDGTLGDHTSEVLATGLLVPVTG